MSATEKRFLIKIFKKLERVTNGFTKEGVVGLSTKSTVPERVVASPKNFNGFSVNPTPFLRNQLKEKHPAAQGQIVFFLQDDFVAYLLKRS